MEIMVREDRDNKLLGRREIAFLATYEDKTPTKEEVKESVCKKLNMNPESTEVVRISQLYGERASEVLVYSYSSKELMQKMAPKVKEKKAKEARAGAAAPAQAPEKKAPEKEEKKEEPNEEKR